jgi:hypothetical protein
VNGMLRIRRSRGATSGVLMVLFGVWGGLIAFVGPYFHFAYAPDRPWSYTASRFWLEILPGVVAIACGLILVATRSRLRGIVAAQLAGLTGFWFALGPVIPAWRYAGLNPGTPVGGPLIRAAEQFGFFTLPGIAIVGLASLALGRLTVVGVRDVRLAERAMESEPAAEPVPATKRDAARKPALSGRFPIWNRAGSATDKAPSRSAARPGAAVRRALKRLGPSADPAAERVDSSAARR